MAIFVLFGADKPIRLKNEAIIASKAAANGEPPKKADRASGLFLIQFTGPFEKAWEDALQPLGVRLVRYVPEDSFICRLATSDLSAIEALAFVHWVGEYRPDHKIHSSLRAASRKKAPNEDLDISVLFSPEAAVPEKGRMHALFRKLTQESNSKHGAVFRGSIPASQLDALASSPAVLWIERAPKMKLVDEIASKIVAGDGGPNITFTADNFYDGSGVTVAVADSGLDTGEAASMHPDLFGRTFGFFFYGTLEDASDEHGHGTHVSGIIGGNAATGEKDENGFLYGLGVAPRVNIIAQRIFDGEGNYEAPPSYETLTRDATRAGADIGSNSWGDDTQGQYDISASEFDGLVRDADELADGDQPYILEFSAGNAGPGSQTIGSPAVGKNVIATGASENDRLDLFIYDDGTETMADFSSRGPCEDGRIKPDVVAPGTWISSLRSTYGNDDFAWGPISDYYMYEGGTSQAGPHISGAAAVLVQYLREVYSIPKPSPALVKAVLIHSAVDMDDSAGDTGPTPNMDEGWGRVDLTQFVLAQKTFQLVDQTELLSSGQSFERRVLISSASEPLKVTMTYSDFPGFPGALPALVNDLDLEVVGPNGLIYRGNQFEEGESVPNAASPDNINNVEGVYISEPTPGEYLVRVRARNVPRDVRPQTPAVDQDFALVIQGEIPFPGTGLVLFDKAAYTSPSSIQVKVYDSDLTNQTTTTVLVKSSTELNGETLTLRATSIPGSFTGSIATATGPALADGRLQIAHNNTITAVYQDAGIPRTATARADLLPPVITSVVATNEFGVTVVSWSTDELANGIVRFNTNSASLSRSATNFTLSTQHSVQLTNVIAGRTYFFTVISTDEAGNVASNNNGGLLFQFTAVSPATVLLVNAYHQGSEPDVTPIPVSSYTNALAQTGVSYDLWDTTQRGGSPSVSNLRSYRIVMWRINDAYDSEDTLSTSDQSAIQQYVNGGGAFFMASMEILSRVGPVAFRTNLLHVARFIPNPDPFFGECDDCDEDHKVPEIEGVPQDPITDNVLASLDYSLYPDDIFGLGIGPDFSDTFGPTTNASPILVDYDSGRPCAMRFPRTGLDATGRVVFLSFPLDTIPENTPAPGNRVSVLRKALQFLAPGLGGFGTVNLDRSTYTVPDFVTVELADSDLAGQGTATATYYSTTDGTRRTLTVNETPLPGLFRGFLRLIPATSTPSAGQLRAVNGGTITLEYFDASAHQTVSATAAIDTQPPSISGVQAVAQYEEATISWDTTEDSDSQVLYGESPLLGRSAFVDDLDIYHEVLLTGLRANRTYYFKVISRDAAGNAVEDDNGGNLYTFQTLPPLLPPYVDNMENNGTNWSVFNGDDSGVSWELGTPQNAFYGTSAHSPTKAWGSNLKGQFIDTADTFLISPAIDLSTGNKANLHFWHNYDFTDVTEGDIIEAGYVYVITNALTDPVLLTAFEDATADWEEVDLDLTPYIGHVIYLVWHYQMLSFDGYPRMGWLVDDVSITATNVPPGTIVISNSLAQASYVMTGPMNRNGRGSLRLTNAPPGFYSVTFGDIPYYYTPPAQSATLAAFSTVVFRANYTFDDANNNGISDAWELHYFGTVSPSRTRFTDTDADGATDYAEFIAGTSPTSSGSALRVAQPVRLPDGTYRIDWPSISGKIYRVEGSTDAVHWTGISDWIQATSSIMTFTVPPPAAGAPYLFRLQVQP